MRRLFLWWLARAARRQGDQAFFERVHALALAGMNVGRGSDLATSGELQVLDLARLVADGAAPVVVDAGANRGAWSVAARRRLGADARILALEPAPAAFAALSGAARASGFEALPLALGASPGRATLYGDRPGSELASLLPRRIDHLGLELGPQGEVPVERLDEICKRQGIAHVHLLKLDVEGNELGALQGAGSLIERGAVDLIQFEFGGTNLDARTSLRDFFRLLVPRYRLLRILRHGFRALDAYRETDEVYLTTNYLALRHPLDPPLELR